VFFLRAPAPPPGLRGAHFQLEGAARLTQARRAPRPAGAIGAAGPAARWGDLTEVLLGRVVAGGRA
jgi:hypothetical protein